MLRLTHSSSAYLENVWVWTADHDLDIASQDQLDIYAARGILIESQGPTWLYGTASEHQVFYQYELYQAENIVMGMIQTESPYFQPLPAAPLPFTPGLFPGDPDFTNCTSTSKTCGFSWSMRILDSSTVYLLGAGKLMARTLDGLYFRLTIQQDSTVGSRTIRRNVSMKTFAKTVGSKSRRAMIHGSTIWSPRQFPRW